MQTKLKEKQNIPKGWSYERFDDRISFQYGSNLPESKRTEGDISVYGSNGIVGTHSESLVKGPGIVIGRKGTIGVAVWSQQDFWPIDTTYYVEHDKSIDLLWLYYELQSLGLSKMNSASGTPGLNRDEVYRLTILVPLIAEQQKIAEVLGTLDEDIEKTKEVIVTTEKLKKGLMQDLFTRGIGHAKFKGTELGEIPEGWEIMKIGDVATLSTGTTPSTSKKSYYSGITPFVKTGEIVNNKIINTKVYVSDEAVKNYRLKKYQPGTVLMAMYGQGKTRGQTSLLDIEACTTQNAAAIEPNENITSEYLWILLKGQYEQLRQDGVQGHISHLNLTILRDYLVIVPPVDEQGKITEIILVVDEKISVNKKLLEKQTQLKKGLMQDLLSGEVRVK